MSLTAHILFNRPTQLLAGRINTYSADNKSSSLTAAQANEAARNAATRLANIERAFYVIAAADQPVSMAYVEETSGLSRSTVYNAIYALEQWEGGRRIIRHRGRVHTFEVAK